MVYTAITSGLGGTLCVPITCTSCVCVCVCVCMHVTCTSFVHVTCTSCVCVHNMYLVCVCM